MKIALDGRAISHPQPGGFKVYAENLFRHLVGLGTEHRFVLYLDRPRPDLLELAGPRVALRIIPALPYVGVPWREQVSLPLRARSDAAELLHFPCLTGAALSPCPTVVTLHDTLWAAPPAATSRRSPARLGLALYMRAVPALVSRRAAAIIAVSEATRRDLVQQLGLPPEKIFVTPEAPNPMHRRLEDPAPVQALRHKHRLDGPFILGLGSADPRKNVAGLLQAYAALGGDLIGRYQLVIAWSHAHLEGELAALASRLGLANRVRFLRRVSDGELTALYNTAAVFCFPSRHEGFGLPPLEAMACGAPVVAGDNSALPEVLGDAALLVDVEKGEAPLAEAIAAVLRKPALRDALVARGLARVRRYSWPRCAAQTLAVYEEVACRASKHQEVRS